MADKQATLDLGGQTQEFPVLQGSVGPDVVDIRKLYGTTGKFTYDPGYKSTASCESALTYIDGEEGILLHRGYPIGQLAEHSNFMEVCYLLLNGELPQSDELDKFSWTITRHTMLHEQLRQHEVLGDGRQADAVLGGVRHHGAVRQLFWEGRKGGMTVLAGWLRGAQ